MLKLICHLKNMCVLCVYVLGVCVCVCVCVRVRVCACVCTVEGVHNKALISNQMIKLTEIHIFPGSYQCITKTKYHGGSTYILLATTNV